MSALLYFLPNIFTDLKGNLYYKFYHFSSKDIQIDM
jgi:hypothetical protein